ncbi:MAG: hypothetical protein GY830_10530 [Bacteroidetes bacterium]|nr:hypothetical protein [Bacteroidota bacterium]
MYDRLIKIFIFFTIVSSTSCLKFSKKRLHKAIYIEENNINQLKYMNKTLINLVCLSEDFIYSEQECLNSIEKLFERGANPNLVYKKLPIVEIVLNLFENKYHFLNLFFKYGLDKNSFIQYYKKNTNKLNTLYNILYEAIENNNFDLSKFILINFNLNNLSTYKTSLFYGAIEKDNFNMIKFCLNNRWYIPSNYKYYNPTKEDKKENFLSPIIENLCYKGNYKSFKFFLYKTCIPIFVANQSKNKLFGKLFSKIYDKANKGKILIGRQKILEIISNYIINYNPGILKYKSINILTNKYLGQYNLNLHKDIISLIIYFSIGNNDKKTDCGNAFLSSFMIDQIVYNLNNKLLKKGILDYKNCINKFC